MIVDLLLILTRTPFASVGPTEHGLIGPRPRSHCCTFSHRHRSVLLHLHVGLHMIHQVSLLAHHLRLGVRSWSHHLYLARMTRLRHEALVAMAGVRGVRRLGLVLVVGMVLMCAV